MQKSYKGLARIYDYLLSGVNYQEWADYLEKLFEHFKIEPKQKIIDLACGTGNSTFPWALRGYTACGVDISAEMLAVAQEKAEKKNLKPGFYRQDMRNLKLPFQSDIAVLYQDGLNYLLTKKDLEKAFVSICSVLRPGGFFIFNLNLVEKLPASTTPEISWLETEEFTLIWESFLEPEKKIWQIKLTAFILEENGLYTKIQEEHKERSYSLQEIEPLLARAGWELKSCYKAFTMEKPSAEDRNIFCIARRKD
ncbi:MAG: class I SAM-dependent methyltransferase [Firmicutes bacterium]|nr:class I SAM-dependent methyltransferase [Bacillota bacterium]